MQRIVAVLIILIFLVYTPVKATLSLPSDPNGQIAFVQVAGKNGELEKDICIVTLDSDDETCITNTQDKDEDHPKWSPDGKILIYQLTLRRMS